MNRKNLPLRKNCEGYFTKENKILAKDGEKYYIIFPGGGVEENETPEKGLLRETLEETGAIIKNNIRKIGILKIIWGKDWAKTEKQKERYQKYQGDEMHFFTGEIKEFKQPKGDSENPKQTDIWEGEKLIQIEKAIEIIEKNKPFTKESEEYHNFQLKILNSLKNKLN